MRAATTLRASAARIAPLAWPVLVGQLSVLAYSTVDTILVARAGSADLAALAVGSAVYLAVFIGFMGVVMAVSPIVGQLFGAGKLHEAGRQVHQALWVALGLSLAGALLLLFPDPLLSIARVDAAVETKVRTYLSVLSLSLPAALLFAVYRGFNNAVSRPKAVMVLQLAGLGLKIPLSAALVFGVPPLGLPAIGVVGCAVSTCVAMWMQVLAAWLWVRRDEFYARFALVGRGLDRPDVTALRKHLRLGLPLGASVFVEVTGFAFMAIFVARLGTTIVAAHQLVANLVSLLFMVPLCVGNASSTLVAQRIGARDLPDARRLSWHGLTLGCLAAAALGGVVYLLREPVLRLYTQDPAVISAALPLVTWLVIFHLADGAQIIAALVLRAYKVVTLPMLLYVVSLWGVGLGGGYWLAFNLGGQTPMALRGATGFWTASTVALSLSAIGLALLLRWAIRQQEQKA